MGFDRRSFYLLIVISLAVAGCKKASGPANGDDSQIVVTMRPELSMERLKVQSYGPFGMEWEMTAPGADGYTQKKKLHAADIKITFFKNGRKATDVTAKEGIIRFSDKSVAPASTGGVSVSTPISTPVETPVVDIDEDDIAPGDMYLSGDVVVISTDGSKLLTDWLWFDKSRDIIFSTAPVRIIRDDSDTKGIGLEATSNLSNIKIFKQTLTIKEKEKTKSK